MAELKNTEQGWRYEREKWHLLRAKWWDYHNPAIYMLTMITVERQATLGRLVEQNIELSPLGKAVAQEIQQMPTYKGFGSAEIYTYVVMPDHVHILLQIHERLPKVLGYYVSWFKRQCSLRLAQIQAAGTNPPSQTCDNPPSQNCGIIEVHGGSALAVNSESNSEKDSTKLLPLVFAAEYHDRILTHKGQLHNLRQYISDNPRRLALKRANPQLFKLHQRVQVAGFECTTLGNQFLIDFPMKEMLQCSRRLTQEEIDQKKEQCLMEAEHGTVFVSAVISEGEKQICKALREEGFPLIILLKDGFPKETAPHYKYFKPQGVYFEACAAGRLLLIEPNEELYVNHEIEAQVYGKAGILPHDTQRYRFLALNAMIQMIISTTAP